MLFSLFVGVIAFSLLYVWLVMHRTRGLAMEDYLDDRGLDLALAARRAEGDADIAEADTSAAGSAPGSSAPADASERSR